MPRVDPDRVDPADAAKFPFLNHPQELGLGLQGDGSALVEEEGGTRGPHVPVQGGTGNGAAGPDALRNVQRIKEFAGIDEPIVLPAA